MATPEEMENFRRDIAALRGRLMKKDRPIEILDGCIEGCIELLPPASTVKLLP